MINNKKWFSLILAMWLVIIISLLAITILEYVIPFSKDIKWVENSSKAYYQANSWIEDWLYEVNVRNNSWTIDNTTEYSDTDFSWNLNSEYSTISSWTTLPQAGEWNSSYDNDWNTISLWNPVQLEIWNQNIDLTWDLDIEFRVPDLDWTITSEILSWSIISPYTSIVNWQLSSSSETLNSSWSIITNNDILESIQDFSDDKIDLWAAQWVDLAWNEWLTEIFWTFYDNNCWLWESCTLKFSIVNKLELNSDLVSVPYLEWQMNVTSTKNIPLRFTKISSSWKSTWFKKDLEVKVASQTVNEAFDFTVFQ